MTLSATGEALTPAGGSVCIRYTNTSVFIHLYISLLCALIRLAIDPLSDGRSLKFGVVSYLEVSHQTTAGTSRHGCESLFVEALEGRVLMWGE